MSRKKISLLQRLIGVVSLLAFLWAGLGSVHGFSFLFAALSHPHKVILVEDHNQIHLILHHPGHYHAHMHSTGALDDPSEALSDTIDEAGSIGQENSADHEFHLSEPKQQIISTTKALGKTFSILSHSTTVQIRPTLIQAGPTRTRLFYPPKPSLALATLRTTVLLI